MGLTDKIKDEAEKLKDEAEKFVEDAEAKIKKDDNKNGVPDIAEGSVKEKIEGVIDSIKGDK